MNIKTPSGRGRRRASSRGGNQQKVVLSKWIFTDPEVLILDEPTRGIDVGAKYEIYAIIHRLADQGKGVLVISSELPELLGICDRIYTLAEGRITGEFTRDEATQESLMRHMTRTDQQERRPDGSPRQPKKPSRAWRNVRQYGMLIALAAIVVLFQITTDGILLRPLNVTNLIDAERLHPDPGDRHGDRHHRAAHRPVGRLGRRVRRRRRRRS